MDYISRECVRFHHQLKSIEGRFVFMMSHDEFEYGNTNSSIEFIETFMSLNRYVTLTWLHELYGRHSEDDCTLAALMGILVFLDAETEDSFFDTYVAALNNRSPIVVDAALRLGEKWRSHRALIEMEKTKLPWKWLDEYRIQVSTELKEELEDAR